MFALFKICLFVKILIFIVHITGKICPLSTQSKLYTDRSIWFIYCNLKTTYVCSVILLLLTIILNIVWSQ